MIEELQLIIQQFESDGTFLPREMVIDEDACEQIVKMRGNPQRFVPSIFDGDWAEIGQHPGIGPARLLRVLKGRDEVARAILRQGRALFIYPLV